MTQPALNVDSLPDDPEVLRGMIKQLAALLTTANGAITSLQQQVEQLVRRLYGRSREKWDPNQTVMDALLVDALEQRRPQSQETADAVVTVDTYKRKLTPHGRSVFPETLKHEEVVIPVPDAERICPVTGKERPFIGYETSKKLDYRPAELTVKVYKREKLGSVAGAEEAGVVTAPVKDSVVPKSVMDDGLLAHVAVSKFVDHLPLYRLEKIFERQHVTLSRRTMSDTLLAAAEPLKLLADRIKDIILANAVVHHDDTPVDLLTEGMNHSKGVKEARLWVATVPRRDGPWTHFEFATSREGRHITAYFDEYRGALMSDDFAGYDSLDGACIQGLRCWVHVRRKFFESLSSSPVEAAEMLERIRTLYQFEHMAADGPEHDEQRLHIRKTQSLPELERIKERLQVLSAKSLPKSPLGKAVNYALGIWPHLTRYVTNPRFPIDNNAAEHAIRPVALGRKNWLFMGSERGGRAAAVYMSLMATCKNAKVNPYEYLRDVLGRIMSRSTANLDGLLPGNWTPLKP